MTTSRFHLLACLKLELVHKVKSHEGVVQARSLNPLKTEIGNNVVVGSEDFL